MTHLSKKNQEPLQIHTKDYFYCLAISKKERWSFGQKKFLDWRISININPNLKNLFDNGQIFKKNLIRITDNNRIIKKAYKQKYIDLNFFIKHRAVIPIYSYHEEVEQNNIKCLYYEMPHLDDYENELLEDFSIKDTKLFIFISFFKLYFSFRSRNYS